MTGIISLCVLMIAAAGAGFVIWNTNNRVQIEFDIHISKQEIYLSTYSEPPQFAIWIENPVNGKRKQVFVTYRVSRGDWEGKADVPVALPHWKKVFRSKAANERSDEEITISGATPKDEYFRVRAEVPPGSEWICWIEMNLAGDYNEYYPQFNRVTKEEDEFSCGQPALLYRADIRAEKGREYTPSIASMSLWEGGESVLAPMDSTITTARQVFDEMSIRIIKPKPQFINLKKVEQQEILK
ncbi:MAG: hypothetical protein LBK07_01495 [Tannerella sp.]|nr:hypothetical protein [Tannerella sp.]